jgi:hypothetical protein
MTIDNPKFGVYKEPIRDAQVRFDHDLEEAKERAEAVGREIDFTATMDDEVLQADLDREKAMVERRDRLLRFAAKGQVLVEVDIVVFGRSRFSFEVGRKSN